MRRRWTVLQVRGRDARGGHRRGKLFPRRRHVGEGGGAGHCAARGAAQRRGLRGSAAAAAWCRQRRPHATRSVQQPAEVLVCGRRVSEEKSENLDDWNGGISGIPRRFLPFKPKFSGLPCSAVCHNLCLSLQLAASMVCMLSTSGVRPFSRCPSALRPSCCLFTCRPRSQVRRNWALLRGVNLSRSYTAQGDV